MHSRLLKGEQWRWYINDVGAPLLAALSVALLWWQFTPGEMSRLAMFIHLLAVSATTLLAAAFATRVTRQWINQKFVLLKVMYEKLRSGA